MAETGLVCPPGGVSRRLRRTGWVVAAAARRWRRASLLTGKALPFFGVLAADFGVLLIRAALPLGQHLGGAIQDARTGSAGRAGKACERRSAGAIDGLKHHLCDFIVGGCNQGIHILVGSDLGQLDGAAFAEIVKGAIDLGLEVLGSYAAANDWCS